MHLQTADFKSKPHRVRVEPIFNPAFFGSLRDSILVEDPHIHTKEKKDHSNSTILRDGNKQKKKKE